MFTVFAITLAASSAASSPPPSAAALGAQFLELLLLAIPIACVAWTVTHEEVFRKPREFCARKSENCRRLLQRKFFYVWTCEYCFSHYVAGVFLAITRFQLIYPDWRGYLLSFFALVWVANIYMNLYGRVRIKLKSERKEIKVKEKQIEHLQKNIGGEKSPPT